MRRTATHRFESLAWHQLTTHTLSYLGTANQVSINYSVPLTSTRHSSQTWAGPGNAKQLPPFGWIWKCHGINFTMVNDCVIECLAVLWLQILELPAPVLAKRRSQTPSLTAVRSCFGFASLPNRPVCEVECDLRWSKVNHHNGPRTFHCSTRCVVSSPHFYLQPQLHRHR